jgi:hypothetical protein
MRFSKKALIATGTGAVVAMAVGGLAIAYWTTTGSGSGSGAAGTSSAVAVAQVGTITALSPGSTPQAVDFSINNTAATNQFVESVAVSISSVTGPNITASTPCADTDFVVVQPTAVHEDLTPGLHTYAGATTRGATLAMTNSASNQDGCKNATVHLAFAAS